MMRLQFNTTYKKIDGRIEIVLRLAEIVAISATVIGGIVVAQLSASSTGSQRFSAMRAANYFFEWELWVYYLFDLLPFGRLFVVYENFAFRHFNDQFSVVCLIE